MVKPIRSVCLHNIKDLVWKPSYDRAIVESNPVDQLVCVCGCNYTGELGIRSIGVQSSSHQKSIAILCRVMLNANSGCLWKCNN